MRVVTSSAALCALLLCIPLLGLGACSSSDDPPEPAPVVTEAAAKNDPSKTISRADADALRAQIYRNWNVPQEPPCHTPLKVRIEVAENGSVVRADAKPELAYDDPCKGALDSAIRAVWASSPLRVPRGRKWSSLTLVFDHDAPASQ